MQENNDIQEVFIIYLRKSSEDEKKQVRSVEDQRKEAYNLAKKLGVGITQEFVDEKKSAKTPNNRINFNKMLDFIEKNYKKDIRTNLICWKINRLSRNPRESGILTEFLQKDMIKIYCEDGVFDFKSNEIHTGLLFAEASNYSTQLSKDVKRGMRDTREEGRITYKAPYGYINTKHKSVNMIQIVEEEAEIIRLFFKKYVNEGLPIHKIIKYIQENKIPKISVKSIGRLAELLKNPLYCGFLPPTKKERKTNPECYNFYSEKDLNCLIKGLHTPIISVDMFLKSQEIFHLKNGGSGVYLRNKTKKTQWLFNNEFYKIKCSECGKSLGVCQKKGLYNYYTCTNINCQKTTNTSEKILEEQLINKLKVFFIFYETHKDEIKKTLVENNKNNIELISNELRILEKQKIKITHTIDKAKEGYLNNIFDAIEFSQIKNENLLLEKSINAQIEKLTNEKSKTDENLISLLELGEMAYCLYEIANYEQKRELCEIIILELSLTPEKVLKINFNPPFDTFLDNSVQTGSGGRIRTCE